MAISKEFYVADGMRITFAVAAGLIVVAVVISVGSRARSTHTVRACRDPRDDKFLELAVNGEATLIVTGDNDLLSLNPFRDIPIITPAAHLSR